MASSQLQRVCVFQMGRKGIQTGKGIQRGKKGKGRYDVVNNDEHTAVPTPSRPKTFLDYIHKLEHKKASVREDALLAIVGILNYGDGYDTLQKYFATCLYHVLGCMKKGLGEEKQLASQVLGLIAMTLSGTENAQEIYKETISVVTEVLPTKRLEPCVVTTLLETLAIVTYFCASNSTETQAAMQIIWEFIFPKFKHDVRTNQASTTIPAVIYAWLFLLTKVNRWEITYKHWKGAISHFLGLLEDTTCVAAGEALALIFDCDNIDKFFSEAENLKSTGKAKSYSKLKEHIKDIILKQLENASTKAKAELPLKQFFNNAARADWDVLRYFKDDKCPQYSERFDGQKLTLSSWSSIIQLKFLKNFLGEEEFSKHMLENELFQHLFEFTPSYEEDDIPYLYESTMEEIVPNVYLPGEQDRDILTRKERKQERQLRQLIIDKSKTKVLNKRRIFAEERKGKMYSTESEL